MENKTDIISMPHNRHVVPKHPNPLYGLDWDKEYVTDETCDGIVYYEEVMEGYVCTKCQLYTGIK